MPDDDEFKTEAERKALFEEWATDYALRREENNQRRLEPNVGIQPPRPSAEILPFPAARPRETWPSEAVKAGRPKPSEQQQNRQPASDKDGGHSL